MHFQSHRHLGHLKPTQVSKCGCQMLPGPFSPTSRTQDSCLTYIHVPSHLHPGTKIPPRPQYTCLTSTQVVSHLHPGHISPPSKYRELHLSPISPHPGLKMCIPSQSRSDLTHIHVSGICASPPYKHLDSCLQSINSTHHPNPGLFIFNSPPFIYCLISIVAHVFASHLHLWHDVRASRLLVAYHYHPCRENCISPPP